MYDATNACIRVPNKLRTTCGSHAGGSNRLDLHPPPASDLLPTWICTKFTSHQLPLTSDRVIGETVLQALGSTTVNAHGSLELSARTRASSVNNAETG